MQWRDRPERSLPQRPSAAMTFLAIIVCALVGAGILVGFLFLMRIFE